MQQLIADVFSAELTNEWLAQADDGTRLPRVHERLVMATDAHVVSPLFFPGGNIGSLAVHGSINDVAMMGARPLFLSASFILEEGLPIAELRRVVHSMAAASRLAQVPVVTGDTKVVERGKADRLFISTTCLGALPDGIETSGSYARPHDVVLLSGSIAEHGMAIMSVREHLEFDSPICSDTAALHELIATLLAAVPGVRTLRDPTRGGLAATLNEIAHQSKVGMRINEAAVPVSTAVVAACELLGLDPFDMACEGRLVAIVSSTDATRALAALQSHPLGRGAAIIGQVVEDPLRFVTLQTRLGGERMIEWRAGEPLPRIC